MANGIYTEWIKVQNSKLYGWESGTVIKAMLEAGSSTYTFNPDHKTVAEVLGASPPFVELVATGYTRPIITDKVVYHDVASDTAQFRCTNVAFGQIDAGISVRGVLLYVRAGSTDNAANDIPVAYLDTATGLPLTTGGGEVVLAVPASGIFRAFYQI